MKHYYTDDGILNFDGFNEHLITNFKKYLKGLKLYNRYAEIGYVVYTSELISYEYSLYLVSKCFDKDKEEFIDQYKNHPDRPLVKLFLYFVEKGYLYNEFTLAAHDLMNYVEFENHNRQTFYKRPL